MDFREPAVPADNPMSDAKVALGARLFADRRLSVNGSFSCQSCHAPERAFTDGLARARGATGAELELNAPTLLNAAYNASLGWNDAGILTLEQQMRGPLFNEHPPELGLAGREAAWSRRRSRPTPSSRRCSWRPSRARRGPVIDGQRDPRDCRLRTHPVRRRIPPSTATSSPATTRRSTRGRSAAWSCSSRHDAGCSYCHGGINFAGPWVDREHPRATAIFADTGTGRVGARAHLAQSAGQAPYMHDGRFATLDAVLDHYERLAADPAADPRLRRAPLTTEERAELRSFLLALADSP